MIEFLNFTEASVGIMYTRGRQISLSSGQISFKSLDGGPEHRQLTIYIPVFAGCVISSVGSALDLCLEGFVFYSHLLQNLFFLFQQDCEEIV